MRTTDVLVAGRVLRVPAPTAAPRHRYTGRYVVRPGDTLTAIAAAHGVSLSALAAANGLAPYGIIQIGAVLHVPAAARHAPAKKPTAHPAKRRAHPAPVKTAPTHHAPPPAPTTVRGSLDRWAQILRVSPRLVRAVAWMESGFQTQITSPVGAWGPMQVMPGTWTFTEGSLLGHAVPHTADGGAEVGVAYLRYLLRTFGGDPRLALAAYYQGPGSAATYGVLPSSEPYVQGILALRDRGVPSSP
jgi:LysM repeat protein